MDPGWLLVGVCGLLYVPLLVWALWEWGHCTRARYLNRWLWLPIIIVFSLVGPLAYLVLGRQRGLLSGGNVDPVRDL